MSAAFRSYVTVQFGTYTDQMYYFGPVVYWAVAEGTCGFFIACVPCLPKIYRDAGIAQKARRLFRGSTTSAPNSSNLQDLPTIITWGQSSNFNKAPRRGMTTTAAYYEMEDEDLPMDNLQTSGSTEQLHSHTANNGVRVTKTANVSFTVSKTSQDNSS